jgi:hypothetical protein
MKKRKKEKLQAAINGFKLNANVCLAIRNSKTSTCYVGVMDMEYVSTN